LPRTIRLVVDADSSARLAVAGAWLEARPADAELLVVGPSWEACDDLVRGATTAAGARFGTLRLTLDRLAVRLATPALARDRVAPASAFSLNAVAARAVHLLVADRRLGYFAPVADRPGFPPAVARTLAELRMNRVAPGALAKLGPMGRDLSALAECVARELQGAGLADRAMVFEAAVAALRRDPPPHPARLPLLLLDLPVPTVVEAALVAALAGV
jgi:ATP-dependent helicase/nuclease subunit B